MFGKLCPKVLVEFGMEQTVLDKSSTKLPANHKQILSNSFLHQACIIHDHTIPAALRANADQTQTIYPMGNQTTWNPAGAKQVSTTGKEEK
jgi:hypothetical protein